jgi:Uma2 family endonuclease
MGIVFDLSVGFVLPNGAPRSPDASWLRRERWETLSPEQRERFVPVCPDFAIELRSPSDRLAVLQRRLRELIRNGVQLGWLIDPRRHTVQTVVSASSIDGDPVLPGFRLDLQHLW